MTKRGCWERPARVDLFGFARSQDRVSSTQMTLYRKYRLEYHDGLVAITFASSKVHALTFAANLRNEVPGPAVVSEIKEVPMTADESQAVNGAPMAKPDALTDLGFVEFKTTPGPKPWIEDQYKVYGRISRFVDTRHWQWLGGYIAGFLCALALLGLAWVILATFF